MRRSKEARMKMTIEEAIRQEKLEDELHALMMINVAQLPGESYEDNLRRRAELRIRVNKITWEIMNAGSAPSTD